MIFRGDVTINGYSGSSTIVGHCNAVGTMTIAAARYNFGFNTPTVETFSSVGNDLRFKPDFTAVDGVNTSVNFFSLDVEADGFPNFFGTSAAAPHAAALAALVKQARLRYYSENMTPAQLRTLFKDSAQDINTPGFDTLSGNGFIRAYVAVKSFAAPTPSLITTGCTHRSYTWANSFYSHGKRKLLKQQHTGFIQGSTDNQPRF